MPETGSYWYNPSIDIVQGGNATELAYWDSVFKRKWVNPEPAHGTWGTEETGAGISTFVAEDIVKLNNHNQLVLEDVINSLSQKSIVTEDVINSLLGSSHEPFTSEDILVVLSRLNIKLVEDVMNVLSLSPHVPYTSEDILFILSAIRHYIVTKEFITNEGAFPIIGGKHLIDTEGED